MARACVLLAAAFAGLAPALAGLGPAFPPSRGALWPRPRHQLSRDTYYLYNPARFNVTVHGETCATLARAVQRYTRVLRDMHRVARRLARGTKNVPRDTHRAARRLARGTHHAAAAQPRNITARDSDGDRAGLLRELRVELTAPCETYPYLGMDESYNLTVSATAVVRSASLWGILRGLESWAQLFYISDGEAEVRINATVISDAPRYAHRGLLVDTARHFLSLASIYTTLDAMEINKMNVLHWHLVDDQSFPYQSDKFPDLSRLGAYHRSLVYSREDIRAVIEYARDRAVRVLPELDVPGHTRSWGEAFPAVLTACYRDGAPAGLGPLDPTRDLTYSLLRDLFAELRGLFPDAHLHVGGDEVDLACWESNPEVMAYMRAHNMSSARELHALFMRRALPLLGAGVTPVVWQEVFDEGVPLSNDTLVQVWKNGDVYEMATILRAGHAVLYSSAWYLDQLQSGGDWERLYRADPRRLVRALAPALDVGRILGGEACMWGEVVDDTNIVARVWPRASAVAERLWSAEEAAPDVTPETRARLEEHACRMRRRGVPAQPPSGPGFCLGAPSP